MKSCQRIWLAYGVAKSAHEEPVRPMSAALAGAVGGPIGTAAYERQAISEPSDRWGIVGRSAVGGSIGSGIGWLAGVPIMMATGIPILPSLAGSMLGGSIGSGVGAYMGARRFNEMLARHHDKAPNKKEHHEHRA